MKRGAFLAILAALLITKSADAAAIFAGGKPAMVHEDYVFLHHDAATNQVHILFAARVAPAFRRVTMGIPTPNSPTIEHIVVDLPDVLHKLIAPHRMRLNKRPPAPPAPWTPNAARFDSFVETARSADHVFDAAWTQSYVDKGFFIAALEVTTPEEDERLEVLSPTAHISFTSERLVLARREPPLPVRGDDDAGVGVPDKPHRPVEVSVSNVEPSQVGLTADAMARILRNRQNALLDCYEKFLEQNPNTAMTLRFESTIRPKGDVIAIKLLEAQKETASKELGVCVTKILRKTPMLSANEGYKFQSSILLTPRHIPARRTHIVTIGSSKYIWRNAPASVRLEEDFEILPIDLTLAMRADLRRSLGVRDDERVWVSHWVDRSARRTQAEDTEFERQDLPPREENAALPLEVHDADSTRAKHVTNVLADQTVSRKRRNAFVMLGVVVLGLAAALGITWSEMRG